MKPAATALQACLQKAEGDGFTIWRTPYSEKEPQGGGFELACVERKKKPAATALQAWPQIQEVKQI